MSLSSLRSLHHVGVMLHLTFHNLDIENVQQISMLEEVLKKKIHQIRGNTSAPSSVVILIGKIQIIVSRYCMMKSIDRSSQTTFMTRLYSGGAD